MQLYFALLFNANVQGFATGQIYQGDSKVFCAPGINCYSCPGAVAACPLGSLQGAFSSTNHSTLYYIGGILLLCAAGLVCNTLWKMKMMREEAALLKAGEEATV